MNPTKMKGRASATALALLFVACGGPSELARVPQPDDPLVKAGRFEESFRPEPGDPRGPGSLRMAERLRLMYEDPAAARSLYLPDKRLAELEADLSPSGSMQRRFELAMERGKLGRFDEAIAGLEGLRQELQASAIRDAEMVDTITRMLSALHMRLGEQENCLAFHGVDSCLLPIQGGGQHQRRRGSEQAIVELERILAAHPDDLGSRWLINVAHMTLGSYPEGLPADWLIPEAAFESEAEIGRYFDIAAATGLAEAGLAGGVITDDFDGDGLLDILVTSWGMRDPMHFYHNSGDGRFEDRSLAAGLEGIVGGLNALQADYDNDGDLDVLVLRGAWDSEYGRRPNSLLRNDGRGHFEDVTEQAGLLSFHPTQVAAWADYDGDGWLDLFIGNESIGDELHPSELFHNQGDGSFKEQASDLGLDVVGMVKGAAWGDIDNDGWPDLYVSRFGGDNVLMRNRGPDHQAGPMFEDIAMSAGVSQPKQSFSTWFWDYDNDGWQDIFVAGYIRDFSFLVTCAADVAADYLGLPTDADRPRLYRNRGDGSFEDVTASVDLDRVAITMGANFGDLDNDGWSDLYLGTGDPDYRSLVPNRMFRSNAARAFQDVTTSGGFGHSQKGHAIAFADLDNDGDQEIYANLGGAMTGDWYYDALYENPGHGNAWITLRLEGREANRSAIGSRIRVDVEGPSGERSIHASVGSGGSFGASSLQAEIGLGDAERIRAVELLWAGSGLRQRFEGLPLNRISSIREGEAQALPVDLPQIDFADPAAMTGQHR
jgi:hypothetical protein